MSATSYHNAAAAQHRATTDTEILIWSHPDYEDMEGTFAELGPVYAEFGGSLRPKAVVMATMDIGVSVTPPEDEADPFASDDDDLDPFADDSDDMVVVTGTGDTPRVTTLDVDLSCADDLHDQPLKGHETINVTRTVAVASTSTVALTRQADAAQRLEAMGLSVPGGSYSSASMGHGKGAGTTVLDLGYQRLHTSRRAWENQPPIEDSLQLVINGVKGEAREDYEVPLHRVYMNDDGTLSLPNGVTVGTEARAFDTLLPRARGATTASATWDEDKSTWDTGSAPLFPSARQFLLSLPADERASVVTRALSRADRDLRVTVRTRINTGQTRSAYAVVSPKYGAFDADRVAMGLQQALKGRGLRGEATYDGTTTGLDVQATYHAPSSIVDFAAGDTFKVGYKFTSNDSAAGSVKGGFTAWWNECLNLIVIGEDTVELIRAVHKGDMRYIQRDIQQGVAKAGPVFEQFARDWGCIRSTDIERVTLWGQRFANVEDALTYGVESGKLNVSMSKDIALEYLLASHQAENGDDTLASIVAAITRAAHERLLDDCTRDTWERQAGLLVPVLVRAADGARG